MCLYLHHRVAGPRSAVVGLEIGAECHVHGDQLHVGLERLSKFFARRRVPGARELAHRRVEDVEERAVRVGDRVAEEVPRFILDERREVREPAVQAS